MKKIIIFFLFFSLLSPCQAQSAWDKMWEEIIKSFTDGDFDKDSYLLGGLDLSGWMDNFLGGITGGSKEFLDGGVFASGGMFDITGGGILNGLFGNVFGFDEIHNDASLNHNVTWGIVHSGIIRNRINERQKKIMSLQDSINMSVKRLYELEKLTVNYLTTKQSRAVEIENYQDVVSIIDDIGTLYFANNYLINQHPGLGYVKTRQTLIIAERAAVLGGKIYNFARVDGTQNLLNNDDRNKIVTNMVDDLRDLRGILSHTFRVLMTASNANILGNSNNTQE